MVEGVEDINILNRNERFCKVFETEVLRNKYRQIQYFSVSYGGGAKKKLRELNNILFLMFLLKSANG